VKAKTYLMVALIAVAIIQLAVPARMIYHQEQILHSGKEYKFKMAPVDPSDPLRGKFINLRLDGLEMKVTKASKWTFGESVYVTLATGNPDGFARFDQLTREKPLSEIDFIRAKISYASDSSVWLKVPFDRYYLEESTAPRIERIYNGALRDTSKVSFMSVRVIDGDAVLNDLFIDGKSIKEMK
jgi:uncharacterized membrane-anchored protein